MRTQEAGRLGAEGSYRQLTTGRAAGRLAALSRRVPEARSGRDRQASSRAFGSSSSG